MRQSSTSPSQSLSRRSPQTSRSESLTHPQTRSGQSEGMMQPQLSVGGQSASRVQARVQTARSIDTATQ
jgi:hypothetical protein